MSKASAVHVSLLIGFAGLLSACGWAAEDEAGIADTRPPPDVQEAVIEEPDLYRLEDGYLYVQNPQTGLNILDVHDPAKPTLAGRANVTGGAGAEMYLKKGTQAIILLKTATAQCTPPDQLDPNGWSFGAEVAFVDTTDRTHPRVMARYCIPGELVDSRTVDDVLYLVTAASSLGSRAISLDIRDPHHATVVQQLSFPNASKTITVTEHAILVAGKAVDGWDKTRVEYIQIDGTGKMTARGAYEVDGQPQSRFHMDLSGGYFRIVTFVSGDNASRLSVLDLSDPDQIKLVGALSGIGPGEQLKATRFSGDRAYIVTFKRIDPMWVVSLKDPANPAVVGALHVPGWSDFIFPRGDKLIAVGRADNGATFGASLFDVSNPALPRSLSQISLGDAGTQSEANVDHRAVTIVDLPVGNPLLVVPYTVAVERDGACKILDRLQLVEIQADQLRVQGAVEQEGAIQRSLLVKDQLFSISDYEVLSVNIADRELPTVSTAVTVGTQKYDQDYSAYCQYTDNYGFDDYDYKERGPFPFMCQLGEEGGAPLGLPPLTVLVGLLGLALRTTRRRRRG